MSSELEAMIAKMGAADKAALKLMQGLIVDGIMYRLEPIIRRFTEPDKVDEAISTTRSACERAGIQL